MSSKYDYVKVKVLLGDGRGGGTATPPVALTDGGTPPNVEEKLAVLPPPHGSEHYYILSRFLLTRMLTFSRIPAPIAARIALDLKKHLVDAGRLELSQAALEEQLFAVLHQYHYGLQYQRHFSSMTTFYQRRIPLLVFICGTGCTGKTTSASQLGALLNNHNVMSTDSLNDMSRAIRGLAPQDPLWFQEDEDEDSGAENDRVDEGNQEAKAGIVSDWKQRCAETVAALEGDIKKALSEGKVLIAEGSTLQPSLCGKWFDVAEQVGAIALGFHLFLPPSPDATILLEQWLVPHSHLLSHLSLPQQSSLVSRRCRAIDDAIRCDLDGLKREKKRVASHFHSLEFQPSASAGAQWSDGKEAFSDEEDDKVSAVGKMHNLILEEIVEHLKQRRK